MADAEGQPALTARHIAESATNDPLGFVPEPGMIVWCLVPEVRKPVSFPPPGPKYRPAFIKTVYDQDNPVSLVVIPGTSKSSHSEMPYTWDFAFEQSHKSFGESGLGTTTRFTTNRIVHIPFTRDYFGECAPDWAALESGHAGSKPNALMGHAFAIAPTIEKAFGEWANELRRRKARANPSSGR